ncbi:MAG TPA: ribonuclease P protein component [Candidatus Saccharimonadales bacterium]|nr:ribonuclease P protein component [Candidatus Saccharimonadales bacterium]
MLEASYRFHGRRSLGFLFNRGKTVRYDGLSLKFVYNSRSINSRCAVVVGRKVTKKAPVRNRIRRRIFEIIRLEWDHIKRPYDIAFFVFDERVADIPYDELHDQVVSLLKSANLYT